MDHRLFEHFKRIGFRKWYERQLLSSHAHMVLAFLAAIAVIGAMEAFHTSEGDTQLANVLFVVLGAAIGAWAMRRYAFLMMRAELAANQASCPDCGDYGRFRVIGHRPRAGEIDVRCSRCPRGWILSAHP